MEIYSDFHTSVAKALSEIYRGWINLNGIIICGTHEPKEIEFLINKIRDARENYIPYLGICYGHQLAAIEYARNVLGIKDATSEEFGKGTFVVKKRPELKVGLHEGESWWNNYEVDLPDWNPPVNFFTTQSHPEYQSSIDKPHPFLVKFIEYAKSDNRNTNI